MGNWTAEDQLKMAMATAVGPEREAEKWAQELRRKEIRKGLIRIMFWVVIIILALML